MADVHINEVRTDLEITENSGAWGSAEMKKVVAMVMEHLRAQQQHEERRRDDDAVTDHAYAPGDSE
jgi:hypothetical protein